MALAFIGIGSNLGDKKENCRKAVEFIMREGIRVINRSSMIETEPWGIKEQPSFINMAIQVETDLTPEELLRTLKAIERRMGRGNGVRWGPRVIDLDILLYNGLTIRGPELEIPHKGTYNREHVLRPLSEIASDLLHPVLKRPIKEILEACQASGDRA